MADIVQFVLKQGRWTMPKDPDDEDYYGIDLTDFLPAGVTLATTPKPPEAIVAGVEVLEPPVIQGTKVVVKLGGLDITPDAAPEDNCCTLRVYLSNGARRDRTLYFTRKDN